MNRGKKSFVLSILLLVAPAVGSLPVYASAESRRSLLDGRWNVVFDMPEGFYETPIEFTVGKDGTVDWAVLGPVGTLQITGFSGRLRGNKLTLNAKTSFGNFKINATLAGDRMNGKWHPAGFFAQLFFKGEMRGARAESVAAVPARVEVFDAVADELGQRFYAPDYNGAVWPATRARYRRQAQAARSDGELVTVVRRMLAELRASHLDFFATPSGADDLHPKAKGNGDAAQEADIIWRRLSPTVGYIKINSFEDGAEVVERIDRAFAELGELPSLVIDLRGNGGGTLTAAMRTGDYLFARARPVGYFATRKGLTERCVRSIDELKAGSLPLFDGYFAADFERELEKNGALMLVTGGRAGKHYTGRIAVLVDEYCFSACEAFASIIKETEVATLIGSRTPGAMLGADAVSLTGGWTLVLPVSDFRTARGLRVEGRGVEPDIPVENGRGKDAQLAATLAFLKNANNAPAK
jgi:hypothetical protein